MAYADDLAAIESKYHDEVERSKALGDNSANALNSANRIRLGRTLAALAQYPDLVRPSSAFDTYKKWVGPRDPASITRTDATTFDLAGGKYKIACSASDWGSGGTVDILDGDGDPLTATFTEDGSVTIDTRWSTGCVLSIATATGVSVTITPRDYV